MVNGQLRLENSMAGLAHNPLLRLDLHHQFLAGDHLGILEPVMRSPANLASTSLDESHEKECINKFLNGGKMTIGTNGGKMISQWRAKLVMPGRCLSQQGLLVTYLIPGWDGALGEGSGWELRICPTAPVASGHLATWKSGTWKH